MAKILAGSQCKVQVSAAIVDASTKRLFGRGCGICTQVLCRASQAAVAVYVTAVLDALTQFAASAA
jgi:hypothetical protein